MQAAPAMPPHDGMLHGQHRHSCLQQHDTEFSCHAMPWSLAKNGPPHPLPSPCSWCGCNNSALFAELVPEERRSTIFAFDRSFEVLFLHAAALPAKHQRLRHASCCIVARPLHRALVVPLPCRARSAPWVHRWLASLRSVCSGSAACWAAARATVQVRTGCVWCGCLLDYVEA